MILAQYLAWETSQKNLKLAEIEMKTRYDSKADQSPILKADIVYLQIPNLLKQGTSKKLQPIFSGPYLVCKHSNIHTATLRDMKTGKLLTRNVHGDRLKRVKDIRNNKFAGRLIKPDNDHGQLTKMWKINDKGIKATEQLLRTDIKIQARPTHAKVKKVKTWTEIHMKLKLKPKATNMTDFFLNSNNKVETSSLIIPTVT